MQQKEFKRPDYARFVGGFVGFRCLSKCFRLFDIVDAEKVHQVVGVRSVSHQVQQE